MLFQLCLQACCTPNAVKADANCQSTLHCEARIILTALHDPTFALRYHLVVSEPLPNCFASCFVGLYGTNNSFVLWTPEETPKMQALPICLHLKRSFAIFSGEVLANTSGPFPTCPKSQTGDTDTVWSLVIGSWSCSSGQIWTTGERKTRQ